ncbi:MAG: 2-hydroxyacyl-CoA dehydratase [Actinobacteria bacterium]|nr:2-hydroxyacyl-CoA dehydratase [Actinomycetota bacterium]
MAVQTIRPYEGLINRVYGIFSIVDLLPYEMSDEEVEGMLHVLPSDLQKTMRAFLIPRMRRVSLDFLKAIKAWLDGAHRAKREGKKVLLVPFNFPPEIVYCFKNAWPITSEVLSTLGVAALEGQGERYWDYAMGLGLPDFACSANMIEVGSCLTESDFTPDAVINDCFASCDINSKTHEFLARYLDIPLLFLEKTVDNSERGIRQYYRYFNALVRDLEEFLEEKLDEERMREVIGYANRATELYWELWDLHRYSPCPVPNAFSLFTYGARFVMWGTEDGVRFMRSMVETSKERLEKGEYPAPEEVARSLWTYTSYYFDMAGLFNWMEENGITHLGDGLDLFFPRVIDTGSRESMLEGLAEVARNMPMTRWMGAPSMSMHWLDDIAWWARELNADCCVYCGHHSCKQTWSVSSMVRNELMKQAGIPTLILQGDSWIRRMTPIETLQELIQEFVDNVLRRGRRRAARTR